MNNILSGFAVINDRNGKRVTYTYDIVDDSGNVIDSNKKASYVVLDKDSKSAIEKVEGNIEAKMNEQEK